MSSADNLANSLTPYLIQGLCGLSQHLATTLNINVEQIESALQSYKPVDLLGGIKTELKKKYQKLGGTKVYPRLEVWVSNYTDKSFIVGGEGTRLIREDLKKKGGLWKSRLQRAGCGAWMWPRTKKEEILEFLAQKKVVVEDRENQYSNELITPSTTSFLVTPPVKKTKPFPPFPLTKTKDATLWWCDENELLFRKDGDEYVCCGVRENADDETLLLDETDVETLKDHNLEWDDEWVDNEADSEAVEAGEDEDDEDNDGEDDEEDGEEEYTDDESEED